MEWEPDDHAWSSYVRLEQRANQPDRARGVYERWVACHNLPRSWMKWAKFEERIGQTALSRAVYERAMQDLDERDHTEDFFVGFAQFEERAKESERARAIYKYALQALPKSQAANVYKKYVQFEKQHGDRKGIEEVITAKKRFAYEEQARLAHPPYPFPHHSQPLLTSPSHLALSPRPLTSPSHLALSPHPLTSPSHLALSHLTCPRGLGGAHR